jgi:hypothetical protein
MTHSWPKINSRTHIKNFWTYFQFSNFPQFIIKDSGIDDSWIQGCQMQLNKVEFEPFTASVYVSETETTNAQANLFVNATATGDCGTDFTVVGTLTDEAGVSITVPLTSAGVLDVAG